MANLPVPNLRRGTALQNPQQQRCTKPIFLGTALLWEVISLAQCLQVRKGPETTGEISLEGWHSQVDLVAIFGLRINPHRMHLKHPWTCTPSKALALLSPSQQLCFVMEQCKFATPPMTPFSRSILVLFRPWLDPEFVIPGDVPNFRKPHPVFKNFMTKYAKAVNQNATVQKKSFSQANWTRQINLSTLAQTKTDLDQVKGTLDAAVQPHQKSKCPRSDSVWK